jgi:hypothetical protein
MKCDSTFIFGPHLCKPLLWWQAKVKVVTPTMKEDKNMFPKLKLMLGKLETW